MSMIRRLARPYPFEPPGRFASRSASTIVLVLILLTIAAIAFMTFSSAVRHEVGLNVRLVLRTRAQYLAQTVASKIDAIVQSRPWDVRFYKQDGPYAFDSSSEPLKETAPEFASGELSYQGFVKDTDARQQRYRIGITVTMHLPDGRPYPFFSTWDRQYDQTIAGSLNRAPDVVIREPEDDPARAGEARSDRQQDAIRGEAIRCDKLADEEAVQRLICEIQAQQGAGDTEFVKQILLPAQQQLPIPLALSPTAATTPVLVAAP